MTQGRIRYLPGAIESATVRSMVDQSASLPTDIDALHALIREERSALASVMAARDAAFAERDQLAARNSKLEHILAEIRRAHFGRKRGPMAALVLLKQIVCVGVLKHVRKDTNGQGERDHLTGGTAATLDR